MKIETTIVFLQQIYSSDVEKKTRDVCAAMSISFTTSLKAIHCITNVSASIGQIWICMLNTQPFALAIMLVVILKFTTGFAVTTALTHWEQAAVMRRPGKVEVSMTTVESVERINILGMHVRSTTSIVAAVRTSSSVRIDATILPG